MMMVVNYLINLSKIYSRHSLIPCLTFGLGALTFGANHFQRG